MSWQELEENYASQFSANVGAPAKPVRLTFGFLYIKQSLRIADEETISIQGNPGKTRFLRFCFLKTPATPWLPWPWPMFSSVSAAANWAICRREPLAVGLGRRFGEEVWGAGVMIGADHEFRPVEVPRIRQPSPIGQ
jgi:hypothetical protein